MRNPAILRSITAAMAQLASNALGQTPVDVIVACTPRWQRSDLFPTHPHFVQMKIAPHSAAGYRGGTVLPDGYTSMP